MPEAKDYKIIQLNLKEFARLVVLIVTCTVAIVSANIWSASTVKSLVEDMKAVKEDNRIQSNKMIEHEVRLVKLESKP